MKATPYQWTPIAQERSGHWVKLPDAPITVREARDMFDAGLILMAQRRPPSVNGMLQPMQIVVKAK